MKTFPTQFWFVLVIFVISGFTGLIYESIWSHYLKLFLGHAAYAQALVLAIFMGGMAVGSWYVGKHSDKKPNLLKLYALAEGVIGFLGLIFHGVFTFVLDFSYSSVFPNLPSEMVHLYKWSVGALLILPQSFLLGTTFPLMSGGLLRRFKAESGQTVSLLYFCNSIGAAFGVIVSGFLLIKLVGLPGTILSAAMINILLAIIVYGISKQDTETVKFKISSGSNENSTPKIILLAALFTGMASFIYEIIWIRMLSMVLGSSTHSFELMLSAFITGLAIGGFWIRNRIDKLENPILFAGKIQILMGLLAVGTIPLYNYTYDLMSGVLSGLAPTDNGYLLFSTFSHLLCLLVMLPATICAGMTFPLFTTILLKNNYGERSIGFVYGANTIGSIIGVFFAVFIALPYMGMKFGLLFGSIIDIVIGAILIFSARKMYVNANPLGYLAGTACILVMVMLFADIDKKHLASGVYRNGNSAISDDFDVVYYKDGRTASINVIKSPENHVIISTNGKPDAAINMTKDAKEPTIDEITMVMAAAVPMAMKPDIKQVANIGFGSGLTSQILLLNPEIQSLDTIEIESAMVEGAKHYLPKVDKVYNDPRSHIHIEDAKTFFASSQKKYDLIVSEPSNPWVSGTASLFTSEFYKTIKQFLNDDALFVQWIQVYELDIELLFTVLTSVAMEFDYYDIYSTDQTNILIVARESAADYKLNDTIFSNPELKEELSFVKLNSLQDFNLRYLGNEKVFNTFLSKNNSAINSDYFPILDLNAERSRYKQRHSLAFTSYRQLPVPLLSFLINDFDHAKKTSITMDPYHGTSALFANAQKIYEDIHSIREQDTDINNQHFLVLNNFKSCDRQVSEKIWLSSFVNIMQSTAAYLQPDELHDILDWIQPDCAEDDINTDFVNWIQLYRAIADRDVSRMRKLSYDLAEENDFSLRQKQFLFIIQILSDIFSNRHQDALSLWQEDLTSTFGDGELPFELTLIYSMIEQ